MPADQPKRKRGRPPKVIADKMITRGPLHAPASPASAPGLAGALGARELADVEVRSLKTQLDTAIAEGMPAGDLQKLRTSYLAAVRLLAQLTGQLAQREITEATIVRTPAWKKFLLLLKGVLKNHPACWKDLEEALKDYGAE